MQKFKSKKLLLLNIAKEGVARPSIKTKLGRALSNYTRVSLRSYDAAFTDCLRILRPDWFDYDLKLEKIKQDLLNSSDLSDPRLYGYFIRFKSKANQIYDPIFIEQLQKVHPEYFLRKGLKNSKEDILNMAKDITQSRPSYKSVLGSRLRDYVSPSSNSYDPNFREQIRKIRPDWFCK